MVTYSELENLRLGKLKKAAEQWKQMADKLDKIANGGGDGGASATSLATKAKSAEWKGENATKMKAFVTKATGEFDDLVTSARSVHTVLDGACTDFKKHKEDLKAAVARAATKNVLIDSKGVARPSGCYVDPDDEPTQAEIDTAAEEVGEVLKAAARTDTKAAGALRYLAKSKYDFREKGFSNFDGSVQVILDAAEYERLARQDPEKTSNKDLERLVALGKKYQRNEIFAEQVATELKPRGSLEFYAGLADKDNFGEHDPEKRMELLADLEKTYGTTLATATQSDSTAMEKWERQVIALGGKEVGEGGGSGVRVYGFQAMSNLMRHGKYETDFLTKYGDELIEFEKKNTGDVTDPGPRRRVRENVLPWDENPLYARNNLMHFGDENDAGTDPMTGYMKALSHNPDASTQFFDDGKDRMTYLLDERPDYNDVWRDGFGEGRDDYDGPSARMNATGDALFAATSGMTPGADSPPEGPHSEAQRQIMKDAINVLGPQGDDMPSELRDSMAKVMTNQGDIVHEAMSHVKVSGSPLDQDNLMAVTKQVSRDPDTYEILSNGMNYAMVADFHSETDFPDDKKHPEDSLNRAGYTLGFMEEARHQAIGDWSKEELTEAGWKRKAFDSAALVGSEYIPGIPVGKEGKIGIGTPLFAGATAASQAWYEGEQNRIFEEANKDYVTTYKARQGQVESLADEWYKVNKGWAEGETGFSPGRGIYEQVDSAANDGNKRFEGGTGDQD